MIPLLVLAGVWLTLARGITPGQAVAALIAAGAAVLLVPAETAPPLRLRHLPGLVAVQSWKILRSTATVMRMVVSREGLPQTGLVEIVLPDGDTRRLSLISVLITLTPGTYVTAVRPEASSIDVHLLDARTEASARTDIDQMYGHVVRLLPPIPGSTRAARRGDPTT